MSTERQRTGLKFAISMKYWSNEQQLNRPKPRIRWHSVQRIGRKDMRDPKHPQNAQSYKHHWFTPTHLPKPNTCLLQIYSRTHAEMENRCLRRQYTGLSHISKSSSLLYDVILCHIDSF